MSSRASVEIWHTILKFSISVPLFFDPDPLVTYGVDAIPRYFHEGAYWDSERTRNSLRRVCHSWNYYLRSRSHRFVRLADVQHGRVSFTVLPTAIRLNIAPDEHCRCAQYCGLFRSTSVYRLTEMWMERLWSSNEIPAEERTIQWKLEILDGESHDMRKFLSCIEGCIPDLKAMVRQEVNTVALSSDLPPKLRSLLMGCAAESLKKAPEILLDLHFLSSLSIISDSISFPVAKWRLPSLRHLSIECYSRHDPITRQQDLLSLLQTLGSNLHTFHYRSRLELMEIDPQLWKALPIVRSIQSPYKWGNGPPSDHPLRSLQITSVDLWRLEPELPQELHRAITQAKEYLPSHGGRGFKIRMDATWYEELFTECNGFGNGVFVLWLYDYCGICSITLIDAHGDSFPEYIVFLITVSRGTNRGSYRLNSTAALGALGF